MYVCVIVLNIIRLVYVYRGWCPDLSTPCLCITLLLFCNYAMLYAYFVYHFAIFMDA